MGLGGLALAWHWPLKDERVAASATLLFAVLGMFAGLFASFKYSAVCGVFQTVTLDVFLLCSLVLLGRFFWKPSA